MLIATKYLNFLNFKSIYLRDFHFAKVILKKNTARVWNKIVFLIRRTGAVMIRVPDWSAAPIIPAPTRTRISLKLKFVPIIE